MGYVIYVSIPFQVIRHHNAEQFKTAVNMMKIAACK